MHKLQKTLLCMMLAAIMFFSNTVGAYAANEYRYTSTFTYKTLGAGVTIGSGTYKYGFLNLKKGTWTIKKMGNYHGYVSIYSTGNGTPIWFANQGQTLTITDSRTVKKTVTETTTNTNSIGLAGEIKLNKLSTLNISIGSSITDTYSEEYSTTYSSTVSGTYDLSNNKLYKHSSYTFASYGIICKNEVCKYDNSGKCVYDGEMYTFYKAYGQEIRLVYRY